MPICLTSVYDCFCTAIVELSICKRPTNYKISPFWPFGVFPGGSAVKNPPNSAGDAGDLGLIPESGRSSAGGNCKPLQCSCWKAPWTEEPGRLQSMGSQRVRHNWPTTHACMAPNRIHLQTWSKQSAAVLDMDVLPE